MLGLSDVLALGVNQNDQPRIAANAGVANAKSDGEVLHGDSILDVPILIA